MTDYLDHDTSPDAVPAGWRVAIEQDCDASDPRAAYEQTATLLTGHRRCRLPFEASTGPSGVDLARALDERGPWVVARWLRAFHDAVVLPVWGHEHGGLVLTAGERVGQFADRFDSGLAGIAYLTRAQLRAAYDGEYPGDEQAQAQIAAEVAEYSRYLVGDVWGYVIERWVQCRDSCPHCPGGCWEHVESLWEVYGRDHCEREALAALAAELPPAA